MTSTNDIEHPPCTHPEGEHILISARKSVIKRRDRPGISIEQQDDDGVKYAASKGCFDPIIAADAGVSGDVSPWKRKGLGPYLRDNQPWPELIGAVMDRLGRNARDLAELRAWCEDRGKTIVLLSPSAQWPPKDDHDIASRILWIVMEQLAELELRTIKRRNANTRDFLRGQKSLIGRACWGFMIVGTEAKKTLAPNPANSCYLQRMIEMAEDDKTNIEIAKWLDEQAIKDENALPKYGGKWAPNSVADILRNESLYGTYRENGKILLRHEGVIKEERWKALQRKLDAKPKRRGPTRNDPMTLTDSLYCDKCNGVMHARRTDGWKRKDGTHTVYLYYRCDGTARQRSTCKNTISADEIEKWLDATFTDGPRNVNSYANREVKQLIYIPAKGHADEVQEIDEEIDALDRSDRRRYLAEVDRLMTERERLIELGTEKAHTEEHNTGLLLRDIWPTMTPAGKREYLIKAGVRIYAYRDLERRIVGDPSKAIDFVIPEQPVIHG
jgi:DNA invertase Pin-like site-specific DNA recombinase